MAENVKETSHDEVLQGEPESAEYGELARTWFTSFIKKFPQVSGKLLQEELRQARIKKVKIDPPHFPHTPAEPLVKVIRKGKFEVTLGVADFRYQDVSIKIIDRKIEVVASREVKSRYGYEYHDVQKIFHIPNSVNENRITAKFTDDAHLIIEGPLKREVDAPKDEAAKAELDVVIARYTELLKPFM